MWEIDELEEGETVIQHLIAGAIAGVAEHCAMFPIDTIKVFFKYKNNYYNNNRQICKLLKEK